MKRIGALISLSLILTFSEKCQDRYQVVGTYYFGFTSPSGNLGQLHEYSSTTLVPDLESGWNIGFDGIYPFNTATGVGLDIHYSSFPYTLSQYNGNYKILRFYPSLFMGSFDPADQYIYALFIGGDYSWLMLPPYTTPPQYGTSYNYSSKFEAGLGIKTGFCYGRRLSDTFGICGI